MVCFAEVTHFNTRVAFVLPDQEFLFQRIQVFRHKDELLSGRILTFMILHGQAFFYPSVSTFIIASETFDEILNTEIGYESQQIFLFAASLLVDSE